MVRSFRSLKRFMRDLYSDCGRLLRFDVVKICKSFYSDVGLSEMFEMARSVGTRGHSLKMSVPVSDRK